MLCALGTNHDTTDALRHRSPTCRCAHAKHQPQKELSKSKKKKKSSHSSSFPTTFWKRGLASSSGAMKCRISTAARHSRTYGAIHDAIAGRHACHARGCMVDQQVVVSACAQTRRRRGETERGKKSTSACKATLTPGFRSMMAAWIEAWMVPAPSRMC